jgi:hypothetical protein
LLERGDSAVKHSRRIKASTVPMFGAVAALLAVGGEAIVAPRAGAAVTCETYTPPNPNIGFAKEPSLMDPNNASGIFADITAKHPALCSGDPHNQNFSDTWIMIAAKNAVGWDQVGIDTLYSGTGQGPDYPFSQWHDPNDPGVYPTTYLTTDPLTAGTTHGFMAATNSSTCTGGISNCFKNYVDSTTPFSQSTFDHINELAFLTPYWPETEGETRHYGTDVGGSTASPQTINNMESEGYGSEIFTANFPAGGHSFVPPTPPNRWAKSTWNTCGGYLCWTLWTPE